jgi:hypothetical protein
VCSVIRNRSAVKFSVMKNVTSVISIFSAVIILVFFIIVAANSLLYGVPALIAMKGEDI